MADDLDPAAVERAARAAFVASALPEHRRYAEQNWDTLSPSSLDRGRWERIARAALAAARDGEAVDRRAIEAEMMDWHEGRRSWANLGPHAPYTPDVIAVMDAQEVVKRAAILAAPSVTAERLDALWREAVDHPAEVGDSLHSRMLRAFATSLGVEVREP